MTLPSEYQEVEYIESSWTQYIDTWLAIKDWFKIICNTEFVSWGTLMALWWYLWQSWWIYYRLYWWVSNTGKWLYWFLGNFSNDLGNSSLNTKYKLELQIKSWNNYFKVNDTTIASWTETFSTSLTGNIWVLAGYADDVSWKWNKWSAKMYDYKIRDNGWTLVRDFIPCYRKSDDVIWLYDLVNDTFYTNAWTWTFTKWPDILPPVPKFTLHWAIQTFHWKRPYEWKPWANTLLYYDFENDSWTTVTNKGTWWSTMNWTASWITFETLSSWKKVAQNTSSSRNNWIMSNWTQTVPSSVTQWCWIKSSSSTSSRSWVFGFWWNGGSYLLDCNANGAWTQFIWYKALPSPEAWVFFALNSTSSTDGNWHLVTWTYDSVNGNKFYIDAQEKTMTRNQWSTSSDPTVLQAMNIRIMQSNSTGNDWSFVWQCWCYWLEDKSWTSEDITNYYNQTKWDYWIS